MEQEENQNLDKKNSKLPAQLGVGAVVVIIFIAVILFNKKDTSTTENELVNSTSQTQDVPPSTQTNEIVAENPAIVPVENVPTNTGDKPKETPPVIKTSTYKDGTYTATGSYNSPAGPEQVKVTLVLKGDLVTDATVVSLATNPASKRFQGEFVTNYKELVVGKSIDSLNLTKVAGSSLTGKGFNDAVTQIKTQAKS